MKTQLPFFAAIIFIAFVSSCEQSENEKVRFQTIEPAKNDSLKHVQELRDDSIRNVLENDTKAKIANKQALQDSLQMRNASLENARLLLSETKANLKKAKAKIGKTPGENKQQIKSESSYIASLEERTVELGEYINQMEAKIAELQTAVQNSN